MPPARCYDDSQRTSWRTGTARYPGQDPERSSAFPSSRCSPVRSGYSNYKAEGDANYLGTDQGRGRDSEEDLGDGNPNTTFNASTNKEGIIVVIKDDSHIEEGQRHGFAGHG